MTAGGSPHSVPCPLTVHHMAVQHELSMHAQTSSSARQDIKQSSFACACAAMDKLIVACRVCQAIKYLLPGSVIMYIIVVTSCLQGVADCDTVGDSSVGCQQYTQPLIGSAGAVYSQWKQAALAAAFNAAMRTSMEAAAATCLLHEADMFADTYLLCHAVISCVSMPYPLGNHQVQTWSGSCVTESWSKSNALPIRKHACLECTLQKQTILFVIVRVG